MTTEVSTTSFTLQLRLPRHLSTASGTLAYSHDGRRLASASMEFDPPVVTIWDAVTGARLRDIETSETIITLVCSADDGRITAAAQHGFTVFDAVDGTVIQERSLDSEAATCFAVSDDDPIVQVVEQTSGEILYTVRIKGKRFQPHVYSSGRHSVKISRNRLDTATLIGLKPAGKAEAGKRTVRIV